MGRGLTLVVDDEIWIHPARAPPPHETPRCVGAKGAHRSRAKGVPQLLRSMRVGIHRSGRVGGRERVRNRRVMSIRGGSGMQEPCARVRLRPLALSVVGVFLPRARAFRLRRAETRCSEGFVIPRVRLSLPLAIRGRIALEGCGEGGGGVIICISSFHVSISVARVIVRCGGETRTCLGPWRIENALAGMQVHGRARGRERGASASRVSLRFRQPTGAACVGLQLGDELVGGAIEVESGTEADTEEDKDENAVSMLFVDVEVERGANRILSSWVRGAR